MQKPRATSAGPVNAGLKKHKSLAGDVQVLPDTVLALQRNNLLAFWLDRQADALLSEGHHQHAERLAHRAEELRRALLGLLP